MPHTFSGNLSGFNASKLRESSSACNANRLRRGAQDAKHKSGRRTHLQPSASILRPVQSARELRRRLLPCDAAELWRAFAAIEHRLVAAIAAAAAEHDAARVAERNRRRAHALHFALAILQRFLRLVELHAQRFELIFVLGSLVLHRLRNLLAVRAAAALLARF